MAKTKPDDISDTEFEAASRAGEARRARGQAVAVRYFSTGRRLSIELATGAVLILPVDKLQGLAGEDDADVRDVLIGPAGLSLRFPRLDVDLGVSELLDGVFGTRKWMAQALGRAGGQVRTERKAEAARENGRLGGRPRRTMVAVTLEGVVEADVQASGDSGLDELGWAIIRAGRSDVAPIPAHHAKRRIMGDESAPRSEPVPEDEPLRRPRRILGDESVPRSEPVPENEPLRRPRRNIRERGSDA